MSDKPLVIVHWLDAFCSDVTQMSEAEIPHTPMKMRTLGWLLREDEVGVTVANESTEDKEWRGVTFIPRGMLDRVATLTPPPKRRKKIDSPPPTVV